MRTTQTIEVVVDDLDQKTPATNNGITLTLNSRTVELDLSDKSLVKLTTLLKPYFEAGRKVTQPAAEAPKARKPRKAAAKKKTPVRTAAGKEPRNSGNSTDSEVRTWAIANGVEVNKSGRVPKAVFDKFYEAQKAEPESQIAA